MKRFLLTLALFLAVQAPILGLFLGLYYGVHFENDPMAAIVDKERRLKETLGPRIIVVGDSGVPFGTVSPMIKEAFPQYNPLNSGLAAGFGHRVLLGEVEAAVQPGDMVVVCFVYELFTRNLLNAFFYPLSAQDPDVYLSLDQRDMSILGDNAFILVKSAMHHSRKLLFDPIDKAFAHPYARNSYNEFGDIDAHYEMERPVGRPLTIKELEFDDFEYAAEIIQDINAFSAACEAKGAKVVFLFPAISEESYQKHGAKMDRLAEVLESALTVPLLNRPNEAVFPKAMLYDTPYHLTGEGARQRTERLVEALREHL
ncbi:MAG: hypothetical protein AAFX93_07855 [Verrucomicrobiota bacterium]